MVQVGVRDEVSLDVDAQDVADGRRECAVVHRLLHPAVEGTGIEADIVVGSLRSHHIGGQIAFVESASDAEGHYRECGGLGKGWRG